MIRILNEILEDLRSDGESVNGKYGHRYILADNSDSDAITFNFDMLTYTTDFETFDRIYTVFYVVGTEKLNKDVALKIEAVEYLEKINQTFLNKLRMYENESGSQILEIMTNPNVRTFFDYKLFDKPTSGLAVNLTIKMQTTESC